MKKEKWIKWEPLQGISPTFGLKKFYCNEGILTFSIQDKEIDSAPILDIHFDGFLALRIVHCGNKKVDSYDVDETVIAMKSETEYEYKWSLFIVENSSYVEWFREESAGIYEGIDIVHYLIRTPNEMFEVLDTGNLEDVTLIWN